MTKKHHIDDQDPMFEISPVTRVIKNTTNQKTSIIQHDHNSEIFTFALPRVIESHDMAKCDSIQVHYINIDSQTKEQSAGIYEVKDMLYSGNETPHETENIQFQWLISHNATRYVGSLNFLIRFVCYGEDGNPEYVWNTAIYSGISVSSGIDNGEVVFDDYADILNQWRRETEAFRLVSLEQTETSTESEGVNVWTATFADGTTRTFEVRNGSKGEKGDGVQSDDLADYVKKTDYANANTGGVIKWSGTGSGLNMDNGVLSIYPATAGENGHIIKKTDTKRPITPATLEYAVKVGVTTNTITLTAEEKQAAQNWLGGLRIKTGKYIGNGTGSSHTEHIGFNIKFMCMYVIWEDSSTAEEIILMFDGKGVGVRDDAADKVTYTEDGKGNVTISGSQCNHSGGGYYYLAIG